MPRSAASFKGFLETALRGRCIFPEDPRDDLGMYIQPRTWLWKLQPSLPQLLLHPASADALAGFYSLETSPRGSSLGFLSPPALSQALYKSAKEYLLSRMDMLQKKQENKDEGRLARGDLAPEAG